mmetsp:Transcript_14140/g.36288  ORF Transcript_14140/g.36288 Transcript_14140/m.36288 type:complete len:203 (+) Transcript_14140:193-801(+)
MPPAVCGSMSSVQCGRICSASGLRTMCFTARRFSPCREEVTPAAATSAAPSSSGTASKSSSTSTCCGRAISTRWPSSPKPVTSVQAVAPCCRRQSTAGPLDSRMLASAPLTQRPAAPRRAPHAAMMAPVPTPLVSSSACPGASPDLRITSASAATPSTENPSAISAPSPEWPPTRVQPASCSTWLAPAIIWKRVSSTLEGSP